MAIGFSKIDDDDDTSYAVTHTHIDSSDAINYVMSPNAAIYSKDDFLPRCPNCKDNIYVRAVATPPREIHPDCSNFYCGKCRTLFTVAKDRLATANTGSEEVETFLRELRREVDNFYLK